MDEIEERPSKSGDSQRTKSSKIAGKSNLTVPIELSHTKSKFTSMRKSSVAGDKSAAPTASEVSYVSANLSTTSKK